MAATKDRNSVQWGMGAMDLGEWPVAASTKIFAGTFVCRNTSRYAVPASDAALLTFAGVAVEKADNSAAAAAAINVKVHRRGVFSFAKTGALTVADIGKDVFISDDQTVSVAATSHNVKCGKLLELDGSSVYVEIDAAVDRNAASS